MLKIINMGPQACREYIAERKVFIFGAGRALEGCLDIYFNKTSIEGIVDNNNELWGEEIKHDGNSISIIDPVQMAKKIHEIGEKALIFISSPFYACEIVEQLDGFRELDGTECMLQILVRNTKETVERFEFTQGVRKIPKLIHYIWVGGKELPDEYKKNIESWESHNPDYRIIRWDETNYNFEKCEYIKEAYKSKCWGFVPNYARLDIIYRYGGIYLDTDVEVIKSFDGLLNDDAFMCMGSMDRLNQGCGFGAVAENSLIGEMKKQFEEAHFIDESGKPAKRPCHTFIHPIMKKFGFEIKNQYQKHNGIVLYPNEVMSPQTIVGMEDCCTDRTVSIHKAEGSWKNEKELNGLLKIQKLITDRVYISA